MAKKTKQSKAAPKDSKKGGKKGDPAEQEKSKLYLTNSTSPVPDGLRHP